MLALKFTQKLLKDMKAVPEQVDTVDSLFCWHANILQLKRKYIIFVNDASRLCLIMEGIRTSQLDKLQQKFKTELKQYLLFDGIKKTLIDQYFLEAAEITIGKTDNRSVTGTMTEMSLYCKNAEFDHVFDLSTWLNSLIYKPIDYEKPDQLFNKLLTDRYLKNNS